MLKISSETQELLKIIAIITMVCDHTAKLLKIDSTALLILGRIAMPIFCFLIAYNVIHHCKKPKKTLYMLIVFAAISQPFFYLAFNRLYTMNVFFTLFLGAWASFIIFRSKFEFYMVFILIAIAAGSFYSEYSIMGVILIILFAYWIKNSDHVLTPILLLVTAMTLAMNYAQGLYAYASVIALVIIVAPISLQKFMDAKRFIRRLPSLTYYIFYPIHLLILKLISMFIKF